jgi:anti-sigma regulatory factor (Ser/Thr protein kinase)
MAVNEAVANVVEHAYRGQPCGVPEVGRARSAS